MSTRRLNLVFLSLILSASTASAELVPRFDLAQLVADADCIVIGTISEVTDLGLASVGTRPDAASGRLVTGRVVVHQTLKGERVAEALEFWSPVWHAASGRIAPKTDVILLLKSKEGALAFVSPYYPALPILAGTRVNASDPLEGVVEAIADILRSPQASAQMKRTAISNLRAPSNPVATSASPLATSGLQMALRDQDPGVQIAAAAVLLAVDDAQALSIAEAVLLHTVTMPSEDLANLRMALREVQSPDALPSLIRLSKAGEATTRREVVVALGHIGSWEALRLLGGALDDEDFDVRFNAAKGVAEAIGGKDLWPDREQFREHEATQKSRLKARLAELGVELR